jgi:hypothetical protein
MRPRARSALLWGLVGSLATLVLGAAAALAGAPIPGWPGVLGAALLAGAGASAVAYVAEPRLLARGR